MYPFEALTDDLLGLVPLVHPVWMICIRQTAGGNVLKPMIRAENLVWLSFLPMGSGESFVIPPYFVQDFLLADALYLDIDTKL